MIQQKRVIFEHDKSKGVKIIGILWREVNFYKELISQIKEGIEEDTETRYEWKIKVSFLTEEEILTKMKEFKGAEVIKIVPWDIPKEVFVFCSVQDFPKIKHALHEMTGEYTEKPLTLSNLVDFKIFEYFLQNRQKDTERL